MYSYTVWTRTRGRSTRILRRQLDVNHRELKPLFFAIPMPGDMPIRGDSDPSSVDTMVVSFEVLFLQGHRKPSSKTSDFTLP